MILKGIIDEDFIQYKKCSMTLMFPHCSFKCDKESGLQVCQNSALASVKDISVSAKSIVDRYMRNKLSESIVFGGLEPLDDMEDVKNIVSEFRLVTQDDIVLYTGYYENEKKFIEFREFIVKSGYVNVLAKVGRFIPNSEHRFDDILGVELASENQYGVLIS